MRRALAAVTSLGLAFLACAHPAEGKPEPAPAQPPVAAASPGTGAPPAPAVAFPVARPVSGPLRFVAIGGGPTPESTEVSLEQDIDLVRQALPAPGVVLFAGGSGSESVRELDPAAKGDPVRLALGDLLAPRAGRQSRYRPARFAAERATLGNVEARLSSALAQAGGPLTVYVAAHGEQGQEARHNSVALWGGRSLDVSRLAELHERQHRPLRLVATSCFSGGFAELAFARADERGRHPSSVPRCGLFAGTWDRETSGCDPNPDRRAQESYGLHFAHALSGTRKNGTPLPLALADFNQDGRVGLFDAHTWARIEAVSFDVPTTTSERWLRSAEPGSAPIDKSLLPEDAAVIERLGSALGLTSERAVLERWTELDQKLDRLNADIDQLEDALAATEAEETTLLLESWPMLDDPFHPDFEATFRQSRGAIENLLTHSPQAQARAQASERARVLYDELGRIGVQEARVLRVKRAYETLHKASALLKKGGPAARYYASLLACERAAP